MIAKLKESKINNLSAYLTSRRFCANLHAQGDKVERQVRRECSMDTGAPVTRGSLRQFLDSYMAEKNRKPKRSPSRPKNNKAQRGSKPRSRSNSRQGRKISTAPRLLAVYLSFLERTKKSSSQMLQTKKFQSQQRESPEEKQENQLSGRSRPQKPISQVPKIGRLPIYDVEQTLDYDCLNNVRVHSMSHRFLTANEINLLSVSLNFGPWC